MDDVRKYHLDAKSPPSKRKSPQQLQSNNVPTDDMENTKGTNKGDSQISHGVFLEEKKGYRKWIRGTGEQLHIDQHIFKDTETRRKKFCYGRYWLTKMHMIWFHKAG